jgi:hypothetical protein
MASKLVIEQRMEGDDKWEAYDAFDDFDTCHKHLRAVLSEGGRVARLIVPGGYRLTPEQVRVLNGLRVRVND